MGKREQKEEGWMGEKDEIFGMIENKMVFG